MTAVEWQMRRSRFNHDWLKNVYLPALAKWQRILDGEVEDSLFASRFCERILPQWCQRASELRILLDAYESSMSPANLVSEDSTYEGPENYEWLKHVLHVLWKTRSSVDARISRLRTLAHVIDSNVEAVRVDSATASAARSEVATAFASFRNACIALSEEIHELESEVLPV